MIDQYRLVELSEDAVISVYCGPITGSDRPQTIMERLVIKLLNEIDELKEK